MGFGSGQQMEPHFVVTGLGFNKRQGATGLVFAQHTQVGGAFGIARDDDQCVRYGLVGEMGGAIGVYVFPDLGRGGRSKAQGQSPKENLSSGAQVSKRGQVFQCHAL